MKLNDDFSNEGWTKESLTAAIERSQDWIKQITIQGAHAEEQKLEAKTQGVQNFWAIREKNAANIVKVELTLLAALWVLLDGLED